jgi:anti-sigma28 factor (negative regulator of flagellin synthesis)
MSTINSVGLSNPVQRIISNPVQKSTPAEAAGLATPTGPVDSLDLSGVGQPAALQADNIRADKVAAIRQQLDAGTYETDDKINGAVDKLLNELTK